MSISVILSRGLPSLIGLEAYRTTNEHQVPDRDSLPVRVFSQQSHFGH